MTEEQAKIAAQMAALFVFGPPLLLLAGVWGVGQWYAVTLTKGVQFATGQGGAP